eukprot:922428-Amphidinium_carterae.1
MLGFQNETVTPILYVSCGEDVSFELHCNSDHDPINPVNYDETAMQHVDDPRLLSAIWFDHSIALLIGS